MERVILHCDANSFYASVCCVDNPIYRGMPLSVCGDPANRHGIVLASTREAKACGIKTGMAIWEAAQKCPFLTVMPANFNLYEKYSHRLHGMFNDYTDLVEGFGADEAWLEIKQKNFTLDDGVKIADTIRKRTWDELGITTSVGVADNKMMAKLGSDLRKPNFTTLIRPEDIPSMIWPLPVSDLMYVGLNTTRALAQHYILTIGQLAQRDWDFTRWSVD